MVMMSYQGLVDLIQGEQRAENILFHIKALPPRDLNGLLEVQYSLEVQWTKLRTPLADHRARLPFQVYYNKMDRTLSGEDIAPLPDGDTETDVFLTLPDSPQYIQPRQRIGIVRRYGILVAQYCAQRGLISRLGLSLHPFLVLSEFHYFHPAEADHTFPDTFPLLTPTGLAIPSCCKGEYLSNN